MQMTIPQKMSNSGSVYDIASDQFDREITGPGKYAVVLSSYYSGRGYTTHRTEATAAKKSIQLSRGDWSHTIIDNSGTVYAVHPGYFENTLEVVGKL